MCHSIKIALNDHLLDFSISGQADQRVSTIAMKEKEGMTEREMDEGKNETGRKHEGTAIGIRKL